MIGDQKLNHPVWLCYTDPKVGDGIDHTQEYL